MGSDERSFWLFNYAFGSSRIASSAYQKWPTYHSLSETVLQLSKHHFARIWSLRVSEGTYFPQTSNHSLYRMRLLTCDSYPGGNFDRNQLLDGSISLSPLYASQEIDLHVKTSSHFHLNFLRLHVAHVKFTIFRVEGVTLFLIRFK